MELIVGTWNQGKLQEMQEALAPLYPDIHLVSISAYLEPGCAPVETGTTYYDNALEKARFYAKLLGKPVLADDGGLELAAFPALLGLQTSRFFASTTDAAKNQELLELYAKPELQDPAKRHITLHACLVYVTPETDGQLLSASASLTGVLVTPRGGEGYGFDPIFYLPEEGKTLAQLPADLRATRSPRVQALKQLIGQIKEQTHD